MPFSGGYLSTGGGSVFGRTIVALNNAIIPVNAGTGQGDLMLVQPIANPALMTITGGNSTSYRAYAYGGFANFRTVRLNGTIAAPSILATNDVVADYLNQGYITAVTDVARFRTQFVSSAPSATNLATRYIWSLGRDGSSAIAEVMRLEYAAGLSMFGANQVIDENRLYILRTYTVATLPTGRLGAIAQVSDANATTFNSVVAGGGANVMQVRYNGTNWVIS